MMKGKVKKTEGMEKNWVEITPSYFLWEVLCYLALCEAQQSVLFSFCSQTGARTAL